MSGTIVLIILLLLCVFFSVGILYNLLRLRQQFLQHRRVMQEIDKLASRAAAQYGGNHEQDV